MADYTGKNPTRNRPGPEGAGPQNLSFRCSDVNPSCNWEARGKDEHDLRQQIEQHARESHNMREFGEETWNKIKNKFRRAA